MRRLVFYFIVLLLAVWGGLKIAADPGYLLVSYQKNTVEMPLWLAVLGVLVLFFILYFCLRLISNIRSLSARLRAWNRERRVRRAWQRTHRGFIALAAGEWVLAEKDLTRAATTTDTPILNYLAAARSAQAQHNIAKRDEYLSKIHVSGKLPTLALGLTQAKLQLREHQYEQALATLQQVQHAAPKNKIVLRLLQKTYLHLNDWSALEILFSQLEKQKVLIPHALEKLQITLYQGLLKSAARQKNDSMALVWQRIPKSLRLKPRLFSLYFPVLTKENPADAETLLHRALAQAENALTENPNDAALLWDAGFLCAQSELWGKARSYLETSISLKPTPAAYSELARVFEKLGNPAKAMELYRTGLTACTHKK